MSELRCRARHSIVVSHPTPLRLAELVSPAAPRLELVQMPLLVELVALAPTSGVGYGPSFRLATKSAHENSFVMTSQLFDALSQDP